MNGVVALRPFVPARDFELAKRFYRRLGFEPGLETPDIAIFAAGAFSFILQNFYEKTLAENFMVQLTVDRLGDWWAALEPEALATDFGVRPPRAPARQPWGLEVAYLFDPSGVLWHVAQAPA